MDQIVSPDFVPSIAPAPAPYADAPYGRDELLHEVFAATALRHGGRLAVRLAEPDPDQARRSDLTYAELRCRVSQFARYLQSRGVRRGDRVVICLPRGIDQYMTLLGVLEAGAAYVPIDWSVPQERADYIAQEGEAFAVITTGERAPAFSTAIQQIIAVDAALGDIAALPTTPLTREDTGADPEDVAYLIYTSGSTGRPKGVMIRHRNICFQIRAEAAILGVTCDDRIFASASLAFDISVEEMWAAFLNGGELLIGSEVLAKAGPDLAATLAAHGVTVWCPVPSLLAVIDQDVPSARIVNVGGEACPPELVRRWARPGRRMINTYGPTETTVTATWTELTPDKPVTIGTPLPGFTAWIVDENLYPVANGAEGELVIGGGAVGAGYLHREELTAEKFTFTPFNGPSGAPERIYRTGDLTRLTADGDIDFLGRIDTQVKIRGYRVELGEIESVLASDTAVAQAVVNLYREEDGSEILIAFLTPRGSAEIDLDRLRALVEERLPAYMRPSGYDVRASLPTLVSGKVDRKALERPARIVVESRDVEPPATATEASLLEAWQATFGAIQISVLDDFFEDLGGHSLRAARMVSVARKVQAFSSVSIQDLYAAPTIRRLAARVDAARAGGETAPEVDLSFHPISQRRRNLCVAAQTVALVPIFATAGIQWIFPYLAYTALAGDIGRLAALGIAGAAFVVMPPLVLLLSIAVKWIVIGRFKPGDYPLWGAYYFRWWFVRRFLAIIPIQFLAGTPMMPLYYRLLGAKIGAGAQLGLNDIDCPDVVTIGRDAILSEGAVLATTSVERGLLRIGTAQVGDRAFMGTMSVLGRNARIGDGAVLDDLSALPAGETIPDQEIWTGSPAERTGTADRRPPALPPKKIAVFLVTLGLLIAAPLLPLAAVIPIAPGLIAMIELDWNTSDYSYMALSPVLALIYVVLMCLLTVVVKWGLLGRIKPGRYSLWSWFYVRFWFNRQLGLLALDLLHPIYATLYVRPWYLALGAKVGRRAEISTATSVVHDLIDIGEESFIADGVVFGAARAEPGAISLQRTRIGRRTFIGNSALLATGADIPDEVLVGVLSKPPGQAVEAGTTWFGSPAIRLPRRQSVAVFDEGARFKPSKRLIATRLAIEYLRITLSMTVFIALFSAVLSIIGELSNLKHEKLWIALSFPFLYIWFAISAGAFVVALKWLVVGEYKPTTKPLWSPFVWKTELVTSTYENLVVPLLLEPLRGTPYINIYLRLMGCKIGKRVFTDTTDITEHDLVTVGDDAALNENAGLQTHLFEDRVMKVSSIEIGARATIGSLAIVLYDSLVESDAQLGDLSVLMKGETLPAGTSWEGSPARPARLERR
ncbi:MAG: Pls/PosA family non-ribosomal peptide synthetase [Caulobacteraceae bacterium]